MIETELLVQKEICLVTGEDLLFNTPGETFKEQLADYVNDLIDHDFSKLVQLLYRLDVNEQKLRSLLASSPKADAGILIASLMIDRALQKIASRKQFKQADENICEDDKW